MIDIVENIGGGLIDGRISSSSDRVGLGACMDCTGFEPILMAVFLLLIVSHYRFDPSLVAAV